eukprot:1411858-Pyramimonas_sp.AAC.1
MENVPEAVFRNVSRLSGRNSYLIHCVEIQETVCWHDFGSSRRHIRLTRCVERKVFWHAPRSSNGCLPKGHFP